MANTDAIEKLRNMAQEVYAGLCYEIEPIAPRVLIWVIPKLGELRDETGKTLIWLPGDKQNKPMYEALVLKVFKPYWKQFRYVPKEGDLKIMGIESRVDQITQQVRIDSGLKPGDHILFRNFEGVPVPDTGGKGEYRLIKAEAAEAVLDYRGLAGRPTPKLRLLMGNLINRYDALPRTFEGAQQASKLIEEFVKDLTDTADVFFHPENKTLSGA